MPTINDHVILSYIDSPTRILIWPADQVLVCSLPCAIGMVTEHIVVGIFSSFIATLLFKTFQKRFGSGKVRSILYWYLPTASNLIKKGMPPSHVRYWVR